MLDKSIVGDAPNIDRTHGDDGARSRDTHEGSSVASPIGVAANHAVADRERVLHRDARVGEGVEPVPHECHQASATGLDAGIVIHVAFRHEFGETVRVVAIHDVGK
jgi:hypothetical protein